MGAGTVLLIIPYVIAAAIAIVIDVLIASAFAKCAEQKGYWRSTYFWICFFLGMIGYCIVAALPDKVLLDKMDDILKQK